MIQRRLATVLLAASLAQACSARPEQTIIGEKNGQDIVTVRVTEATAIEAGLAHF